MLKSEVECWARLLRDGCQQGPMEDLRAKLMNVPDQERVWEQFVANTSANLVLPLKIHSTPLLGEVITRYIVVVSALWPRDARGLVASESGQDVLKLYFERMGSMGAGSVWCNSLLRTMFPLEHPVRPLWVKSLPPVTWLNLEKEIVAFLPPEGLDRLSWLPWSRHSNANHSLALRFLPEMAELMTSLGNTNWETPYVLDMANMVYGRVEPRHHGLPLLEEHDGF